MSNDTETLTLTDFLLARIAEDEASATEAVPCPDGHPNCAVLHQRIDRRVLAECEAKRRIVERTDPSAGMNAAFEPSPLVEWIHRQMALPHSDHPDYREEWKP